MVLLADSGSTKADWRLIDGQNKIHHYKTMGFNPYYCDTETISLELRKELIPEIPANAVSQIFFYGAGCSSKGKCEVVRLALEENFKNAKVEVYHDLLGAARALCGRDEGIAAILGTGSNSCYYDGGKIVENIPALSYILGDEGSGAYMGKELIRAYLYKELPGELSGKFDEKFNLSKEDILITVYEKPLPNRFLASFSKFLFQNIKNPYVEQLVYSCFEIFFNRHICKYPKHKDVKMGCAGSVGYFFSEILKKVAADKGVVIDKIIKNPVEELTLYHINLK
ncbi:MAG: N-acetylglucosamine kinase [Bacteroidota bacterium]